MNMTRATRQIRPARIPNQESSAPIRVPSPLFSTLAQQTPASKKSCGCLCFWNDRQVQLVCINLNLTY